MPTANDPSRENEGAGPESEQPSASGSQSRRGRLVAWLLVIGIVTAGAAYLLANRPPQSGKSAMSASVPTVVVRTGTLDRTLLVTGQTAARNFKAIVVPVLHGVPGMGGQGNLTLTKLIAGGGQVKTGDVVAELDPENVLTQLDDYKSSIEQSELDLNRLKAQQAYDWEQLQQTLRSSKAQLDRATLDNQPAEVKTPIERELLKLAVEEAAASYQQQQATMGFQKTSQTASLRISEYALDHTNLHYKQLLEDLQHFTFKAPMDGLVVLQTFMRPGGTTAQYQVGDAVGAGQVIMKIVDTNSMQLEARASQSESSEIRVGQAATITLDAFPGLELPGKVYSLGAMATQGWRENYFVRTVSLLVRIQGNDPRLLPDLTGAARISLGRQENALLIPLEAIRNEGGKSFVYLKTATGFEKRFIAVGLQNSTHAAVSSGLRAGDEVALEAPPKAG